MGKHLKKPVSLRLGDQEIDLLERLADKHGGKQAAIVAGLKLLDGSEEITKDQVIDWIRRKA